MMQRHTLIFLFLLLFACSCQSSRHRATGFQTNSPDSLVLADTIRQRPIPVVLYWPDRERKNLPVIVLSHGYNQNIPGAYKDYSYLANALTAKGYLVVSIQHENQADPLLAMSGNLYQARMPNWERGVENIRFVLRDLPGKRPGPDYRCPVLIGHSNGGDISILFAQKYPDVPAAVISLDNRRMPLPRKYSPHILSLRSSDQPADSGVIPSIADQKKYGTRILQIPVPHNEMDNDANDEQRKAIIDPILAFLEENRHAIPHTENPVAPALKISSIGPDCYVYTSYGSFDGQPYPANGMYLLTKDGAVIFDTPWDTTQFQPLLDSIRIRHGKTAIMCIATHYHDDRTAGLNYFRKKGLATWSSALTYDLCSRNNKPKAAYTFSGDTVFRVGGRSFRVFYPGAGHSKDNIVAWLPEERILYGGCFIKSTDSKTLGNLEDADLHSWPASIKKVMLECPEPAYVIPGHQGWEDNQSLAHTLKLLRKQGKAKK